MKEHTAKEFHRALAQGSAHELTEAVSALMGAASGHDRMWRGRAEALNQAIAGALVEKREKEGLCLDLETYRRHINLRSLEALSTDGVLSNQARENIRAYLMDIPGWKAANEEHPDHEGHLWEQVGIQFGYQTMYLTAGLQRV